ncbi:lycopene cyclase family protein [Aquimarina sp. AU474]|uniref:lycopene cyclase family protein n=1 Tax=Aquimarina sp. AU474 TaxID=2108529 RepID=UPI000D69E378|nr:lycopene cyclase family protein [Aquimarina sp. AU474]
MQKYNYIITGMGASGLMLVNRLISDSFFDQKKILLIDKEIKNQNDRTWCFWEKDNGEWDQIVTRKWDHIYFGSEGYSKKIEITPYRYKMIRSSDFYNLIIQKIKENPNITVVTERLNSLKEIDNFVEVKTDQNTYVGEKVFNSIVLNDAYKNQTQFPVLNQHFVGWFVKTKQDVFDPKTATFMDFTVTQKGNTRFMYVLPTSKKEALLEYTLFSEKLLPEHEYEEEIKNYLANKGITEYDIIEKEKGCIPMTVYSFDKSNSKNILHIGTAGGWTKPSTGYTFYISSKKVKQLTRFLKTKNDLSQFQKRTRFWFYDLLFLDVLYKENGIGSQLFSILFKKNDARKILKFLDEETSFVEEIKITTSLPKQRFLKALWRRVF